ncbi:FxsA family protein [Mycobacterium sp.]|uniref:FxsA family protein n=1 Tax=Mycobacterium sp. TaxID=1785 RepID=UPI003C74E429
MLRRLLLIYAIVELAVMMALVWTIGWGWTLLILLASFVLGWGLLAPMAGSHLVRQIGQLQSGRTEPRSAVRDSAAVTMATALVLIPGLVSTALGLLLLIPPIRSVAGPGLTDIAVRGFQRRIPLISYATDSRTESRRGYSGDGPDYIDGEVIDVYDVEPPA